MNTHISTDLSTDLSRRHDTLSAVVLAALVGVAGLAALLNATVTATGHPVLVGLGLTGGVVLTEFGRWAGRRVRERREDAADLLAAAAWRAEHLPHHAELDRDRPGVA